jgi:hypothetical protein
MSTLELSIAAGARHLVLCFLEVIFFCTYNTGGDTLTIQENRSLLPVNRSLLPVNRSLLPLTYNTGGDTLTIQEMQQKLKLGTKTKTFVGAPPRPLNQILYTHTHTHTHIIQSHTHTHAHTHNDTSGALLLLVKKKSC